MRRVLIQCSLGHRDCMDVDTGPLPHQFQVIDVQKRCIVKPNKNRQYVALSYVWDAKPDITRLKATRASIVSDPGMPLVDGNFHDAKGRRVGNFGAIKHPLDDNISPTMTDSTEIVVELIALSVSGQGLGSNVWEFSSLLSPLAFLNGIPESDYMDVAADEPQDVLSDCDKYFTFFDQEGNFMPFLPTANVMSIEWSGPYARQGGLS
ncbi:hypothetical protein JOL62DRAFT_410192 [Phyllosticta paracitricarpa]|uniref:Uncharacterized protein n=1 Tax=Phyllosticta paracitricarpa TaxID=2016321 RepID=A0ABR1NF23_9PEZI